MKKISTIIAVLFLFSTVFVASSFAAMQQERGTTGQTGTQSGWMKMQDAARVSKIMGKTVTGQQGEDLGKVEDVVIGEQGRVSYVILSGDQNKLYPIPMQSLREGKKEGQFAANISKDQLKNAPSFTQDNWPNLSEQQWEQRVFSYYGEQPPTSGTSMPGMRMPSGTQSGTGMESGGTRSPQ